MPNLPPVWWPRRAAVCALLVGLSGAGPVGSQTLPPPAPVSVVLDNGLRLLYESNPSSPVVAICAFVQVSAAQETFSSAGVRELLQLRGERTQVRPGQETEGLPPILELRVSVSRDYVEALVLCLPEGLEGALRRLRAVLFEPYLDEAGLRFARERLGQEVAARQSVAISAAQDALVARLYPEWPGSWPLVGTGAAQWVDLDYLRRFHQQHYLANRTLLTVSGPLPLEAAQGPVETVFGNLLPGGTGPRPSGPPVGAAAEPGWVTLSLADSAVSVVAAGGRAPTLAEEDYPAASVALVLLGQGRGSRLYRRLREERGLSYTIQAGLTPAAVCPYAYVLASCAPAQADQVREALQAELVAASQQAPTEEEVQRARQVACGQYLLQQQDSRELAHYLGLFALLGGEEGQQLWRTLPLRLAAVTPDQVQQVCQRMWGEPVGVVVAGGAASR